MATTEQPHRQTVAGASSKRRPRSPALRDLMTEDPSM